ncbi:hypothetical protein B0F90DRAFT_1716823 [Multifurca ochricompacta]|uniref:Uncharacterized protein n=1 Tax=Multifurca ochricompacta TaxID=376703 RepID=A0AAD4QNV1_9AGAM|nr:hypothetical protein B0F90DRAFT_1716823 [Multifurca ochricompacta]
MSSYFMTFITFVAEGLLLSIAWTGEGSMISIFTISVTVDRSAALPKSHSYYQYIVTTIVNMREGLNPARKVVSPKEALGPVG